MLQFFIFSLILFCAAATDITPSVFGPNTDVLPAAFGDFDSDEYTDLFVLKDRSSTLEILLGGDVEPFLRESNLKCNFKNDYITSVVPGDFDGDALMDVFVTLMTKDRIGDDYTGLVGIVLWGGLNQLNCTPDFQIPMKGQPLAIDYDRNMIIDLFGVNSEGRRTYWIFNNNRTLPQSIQIPDNHTKIPVPNSHAYLDLNGDSLADLFITTLDNYEIWVGNSNGNGFAYSNFIPFPPGVNGYKNSDNIHIGQTVFQDFELEGKLDLLVPICFDSSCTNSTVFVYSDEKWHNLKINFHDGSNLWTIPDPKLGRGLPYLNTITFRSGDFNMDGYPDLLATLVLGTQYKSFFLENVECTTNCDGFSRTFIVRWSALNPYNNDTVLGVFYDFLQDGILDVILVHSKPTPTVSAFKNSLDYDANFVKIMIVTGLTNKDNPLTIGPLGKKRRTYGTNLPGPRVSYSTTTQEGNPRAAVSTQLPQSAHYSLNLPYIIFGLGRTPNFVDSLTVSVYGYHQNFPQTIPNSQMVVIPWPTNEPKKWRVQLFVTPSKLILQSVVALLGTCVFISIIIAVLYWKERREDHFERLQEAHRFHFDAM